MSTDKNLWMGDVQPWMDDSFIMNAFNFYNFFPKSIKLIHDKLTGELKNFCFINFQTIEEANNCLSNLSGKIIPNTQIKFKLNWANYFSTFNKSVYVGNLSPDVDDIKLYNLFKEKYPTVHHASVIMDKGVSKGFGFILFRGEEDYEKCLKEMNGIIFHGNAIKVSEQKKNNKNINSQNFSCDNLYENENDEIYNSDNNSNIDVVYNYGEQNQNSKYNIINNNMNHILSNVINDINNINNNSFIDPYNLNSGIIKGYNNNEVRINKNINNGAINNANKNQGQKEFLNQIQLNNMNINNPKIINNIININNINKIQNINYINDINKTYNNIFDQNGSQINNNYINSNQNNIKNNNLLDLSNRPEMLYLNTKNNHNANQINFNNKIIKNNNIINKIEEEKSMNLKYINKEHSPNMEIMNKINALIISNKIKNKKGKKENYKLEILHNYDDKTFCKTIEKKLDIMYKYYIEKYPYELNKLILSNMFIYYCQNEKQLKFYSNIF